jgi:hypothetical protein
MNYNSDATPSTATPEDQSGEKVTVGGSGITDLIADLDHDSLGFKPYVEAVYSFLLHKSTKPPFTFSVEGEWGAGKSSFMYQLEQSLDKDPRQKTVRFNAWRHDKVEAMWAAFALNFTESLTRKLPWYQRFFVHLEISWTRFDWSKGWFSFIRTIALYTFYIYITVLLLNILTTDKIKEFIPKDDKLELAKVLPALGWAGVLIAILLVIGKLAEYTGNPLKADLQKFISKPNYEGNASFIEEFHRDFDRSVKVLTRKHNKIFVFIDDLDRADIPKAAELMQGLNMMISNATKLIFIIGMDREKVAAGIAAKYKDLLPFLNPYQAKLDTPDGLLDARMFGYNFLEKFIQVSFNIPRPDQKNIVRFINSLSAPETSVVEPNTASVDYRPKYTIEDGEKESEAFKKIVNLVAPFFDNNPRRLKQYINSFRLQAHIANSIGLFNEASTTEHPVLTIQQLGKFLAIIMLWPNMVEELNDDPKLLKYIAGSENGNENGDEWKKVPELVQLIKLTDNNGLETSKNDYNITFINILALLRTSTFYRNPASRRGPVVQAATTTRFQSPSKAIRDPS